MDNLFLVQLKIRYININHNIIILISSYPFISLINCPWLLFHGIILLSFYCIFFDCIYFVDAKVSSISTPTVSRISITLAFLILLTFIYYWIRDVIREAIKKYEVLPAGLFIVFLIFVFSEGYNNPDIQKRRIKYINVPSYLDYYYWIINISNLSGKTFIIILLLTLFLIIHSCFLPTFWKTNFHLTNY